MLDFLYISTRNGKKGVTEIYPKFFIKASKDLMIRGGDFYAIWNENTRLWSTNEFEAIELIDKELDDYAEAHKDIFESYKVLHLQDASTGMIDEWHKYCQRQMRDSFHSLDDRLIFSNTERTKDCYASKSLPYPLEKGPTPAYDELMDVLYAPEERQKLEWAIGSIVNGDSKTIQKFVVLYGLPGSGKSTVLNIIQMLFEGYYSTFDSKALASASNAFALEAFRSNPLIAIEHDGDLSRIEDNTRINSLVSHETMLVNEKFMKAYSNRFKTFLFMGTNKPVRITDSKSGIIRRLIDVEPSGDKIPVSRYNQLMSQVAFELPGIAWKCKEFYEVNKHLYDSYVPVRMMSATNDFYNFMLENYYIFKKEDGVSLKIAWEMYKTYVDNASVPHQMPKRIFKEELRNYFHDYFEQFTLPDGSHVRNYFKSFKTDKFELEKPEFIPQVVEPNDSWIDFKKQHSLLDDILSGCPAQYTTRDGKPLKEWSKVKTKLSDLDTSKLHYVKMDCLNHIVIDFDIPGKDGKKDFEANLAAASKWPRTYAELSKSGAGIHLHYIYDGDVSKLSRIYDEHIEVKVYPGDSSLRRMLTKCNDIPIATINSGLPLKGESQVKSVYEIKSERQLRVMISRNLAKEYHSHTTPSISFIKKLLDDAYESGILYDVSDMRPAVLELASQSSHQASACIHAVATMRFKSKDIDSKVDPFGDSPIVFFDCEVFPNLFLVCWKFEGKDKPVMSMFNPSPNDIETLIRYRLIGFNNRKYDNHMLYGCMLGMGPEDLYQLSQSIINFGSGFFGEAYNLSYTDIYDFSSKKQSLKKFEIELGIHHQELGFPWNQPVPEELWDKVAEYCKNDVLATEATFNSRHSDFVAREILADIAEMSVNDTTNSLTTKIIFEGNKHPQLVYTDLSTGISSDGTYNPHNKFEGYEFRRLNHPGETDDGYCHNMYRGVDLSLGGYVYHEVGMYTDIGLLDVESLHPNSAIQLNLFGEYTSNFKDLLDTRLLIKHGEYEKAKALFSGRLAKYLDDPEQASALAQALKIAINSVYGLTSASFSNPFRDPRNVNNIVALRGALFMKTLMDEVKDKGFGVAHIKTDSIKIPNVTPDIIKFCKEFANEYGYTFDHEATYTKMCLVNKAVYIAKYATAEWCEKAYGYIPKDCKKHGGQWTATGTQFQVPYVFKSLFSREEITFDDLCETKSVSKGAIYLDKNESLPEGEHNYIFVGRVGQFSPVLPGNGGGVLVRESGENPDGTTKYANVTGSSGYRWLESEMIRILFASDPMAVVDMNYYHALADDAINAINEYGDYEWFVSDDPGISPWDSPGPPWEYDYATTAFDVR